MESWHPDLRLKPSRHLQRLAIALGVFASMALLSLPLTVPVKVFFLLLFVWLFRILIWRFFCLKTNNAVKQLRFTDVGWFVRCVGQDSWQEMVLLGDSVVTGRYVFLRFAEKGLPWYKRKTYPVLIAADSLQPEQFRRLKVFLRFLY